jgi:hypothetical protein
MARRKTRQQKIIADLRRQLPRTEAEPIKQEFKPETASTISLEKVEKPKIMATKSTYTNPYLGKDLRKTAILTGCIGLGQIVLFFLLKQHLLVLPGLSY